MEGYLVQIGVFAFLIIWFVGQSGGKRTFNEEQLEVIANERKNIILCHTILLVVCIIMAYIRWSEGNPTGNEDDAMCVFGWTLAIVAVTAHIVFDIEASDNEVYKMLPKRMFKGTE